MKRKPLIGDIIGEVEARVTGGGYSPPSHILAIIKEVRRLRRRPAVPPKLVRMARDWMKVQECTMSPDDWAGRYANGLEGRPSAFAREILEAAKKTPKTKGKS
jgi:hypothetical protein